VDTIELECIGQDSLSHETCPGREIHTRFLLVILGRKFHTGLLNQFVVFQTCRPILMWLVSKQVFCMLGHNWHQHASPILMWWAVGPFLLESPSRTFYPHSVFQACRQSKTKSSLFAGLITLANPLLFKHANRYSIGCM